MLVHRQRSRSDPPLKCPDAPARVWGVFGGFLGAMGPTAPDAGNQTKITYPTGESVEHTFDTDGRLERVKDRLGNTTSFAYDPDSNVTSTVFPEGTGETDRSAYNLADQMTEASFGKGSETLASLSYGRDDEGQVASTTTSDPWRCDQHRLLRCDQPPDEIWLYRLRI